MRVLDALLPGRNAPAKTTQRSESFDQWANDYSDYMTYGGIQYPLTGNPVTTWGKNPTEPIGAGFVDYVTNGLQSDGVVSAIELVRYSVFAEARFQWQRFEKGRPGDLWGDPALSILEHPWPGGTTGDLLARMILDADLAGNSYTVRIGDALVRLRPDWTRIILGQRRAPYGATGGDVTVGYEKVGYLYVEGGFDTKNDPAVFLPDEVCHFAPYPDPLAAYRGMSWLTPVVREIQADRAATSHKLKFFENSATPNLVVKAPEGLSRTQFEAFVTAMDEAHVGAANAYKNLYLAGGTDVTVVGADLRQLDFKATQGAGETRLAAAAGIHPVLIGLSEGLQGSSLNAGNYQAAKRATGDKAFRPLWRNVSGSLEVIVRPPTGSRLWTDSRDIAFLREDVNDLAEIQAKEAQTIRTLGDGGWDPESIKAAIKAQDWALLKHSGLVPVQLQKPGAGQPADPPAV